MASQEQLPAYGLTNPAALDESLEHHVPNASDAKLNGWPKLPEALHLVRGHASHLCHQVVFQNTKYPIPFAETGQGHNLGYHAKYIPLMDPFCSIITLTRLTFPSQSSLKYKETSKTPNPQRITSLFLQPFTLPWSDLLPFFKPESFLHSPPSLLRYRVTCRPFPNSVLYII